MMTIYTRYRNLVIYVFLLLFVFLDASAKQVSEQNAYACALTFLKSGNGQPSHVSRIVSADKTLNLVYTAHPEISGNMKRIMDNTNLFYVFNISGGGFVIVAADDCVRPILAYSDNGCINMDSLAPGAQGLLNCYRTSIEDAISRGVTSCKEWQNIRRITPAQVPLITTHWNQLYPYNAKCPIMNGKKTVTGCVATAIAQIMNYWKYPDCGEGEMKYTSESGQTFDYTFSSPLRWNLLHNDYRSDSVYGEKEVDAISNLMYQCGIASKMTYDTDGSGTIADADNFVDHFKYQKSAIREYNSRLYSIDEWYEAIKSEIDHKRPILYTSDILTHAFVVDGYADSCYVHTNFGWGGISDGYWQILPDNFMYAGWMNTFIAGIVPKNIAIEDLKGKYCKAASYSFFETDTGIDGVRVIQPSLNMYPDFYERKMKVATASVDEQGNIINISDSNYYFNDPDKHIKGYNYNPPFALVNTGDTAKTYLFKPAVMADGKWETFSCDPVRITVSPGLNKDFSLKLYLAPKTVNVNKTTFFPVYFMNSGTGSFVGDLRLSFLDGDKEVESDTLHAATIKSGAYSHYNCYIKLSRKGTFKLKVYAKSYDCAEYKEIPNYASDIIVNVIDTTDAIYISSFRFTNKNNADPRCLSGDTLHFHLSITNPSSESLSGFIDIYESTSDKVVESNNVSIGPKSIFDHEYTYVVPDSVSFLCFSPKYRNGNNSYTLSKFPLDTVSTQNSIACVVDKYDSLIIKIFMDSNVIKTMKKSYHNYAQISFTDYYYLVGHNLILKFYDSNNQKVADITCPFGNGNSDEMIADIAFPDNIAVGQYTMKVYEDYDGHLLAVTDTTGHDAIYTIKIVEPEPILVSSKVHIDNEVFDFSSAYKQTKLQQETTSPVPYCLTNYGTIPFNGYVAVFGTDGIRVSEELPVTLAPLESEQRYGYIHVTLPAHYMSNAVNGIFYLKQRNNGQTSYNDLKNANGTDTTSCWLEILDVSGITNIQQGNICYDSNSQTIRIPSSADAVNISIFDIAGRQVYATHTSTDVNIAWLRSGAYILKVNVSDQSFNCKFIKK